MASTSGTLPRASSEPAPSGYSPVDDAYKVIAIRNIGSSEYGQEVIGYVLTSSSAFFPRSGDTGGRGKSLVTGETTTISLTVSTSTDGLSGDVDLRGLKLAAIEMSTDWTTANITFAAASATSGTFYPVYDDLGSEVTVTSPAASRIVTVDNSAGSLAALRYLKLRSGTNGTPVAQAASRAITLILKG